MIRAAAQNDNTGVVAPVTLTGSGFGTKPTAAPVFFSTFESAVLGTSCTDASVGLSQIPGGSGAGSPATVSNVRVHSGTKSLTQPYTNAVGDYFPVIGVTFGASDYIYEAMWVYTESTGGTDLGNQLVKYCRGGCEGTYSGTPQFYDTGFPDIADCGYNNADGGAGHQVTSEDGSMTWGAWHFVEYMYKLSTAGVADGFIIKWVNGVVTAFNAPAVMTRAAGVTRQCDHAVTVFDGCQTSGLDMRVSADEMLIDNTLARVIGTDNATYASSTKFAPQAPSAWSDTSITIPTPNYSNFSSGAAIYFHIFNTANAHVTSVQKAVP